MTTFIDLEENFKFLVLEVSDLMDTTREYLHTLDRTLYNKIVNRDDYIDNLKTVIENKCFSTMISGKLVDKKDINKIRSIQIICVNLERIADFCVNIAKQLDYLKNRTILEKFHYLDYFDKIQKCFPLILPALEAREVGDALIICQSEFELDELFRAGFSNIMQELQDGRNVADLITVLFILRYLERVGDSLLNIGEALLLVAVGEKIKITQFRALQQTLNKSGYSGSLDTIDYESFWGTQSGCNISRISTEQPRNASETVQGSIFKGGSPEKIRLEMENIERWNRLFPGLVPKVYSFHEEESNAAMLVEFLPGCTLDQVVLTEDEGFMAEAISALGQNLKTIWDVTKKVQSASTSYMEQVLKRLEHVRLVHPDLYRNRLNIGETLIRSTKDLITECRELETMISAPFVVLIHGDLNINNIVYNPASKKLSFVDLHRSQESDYVQDISVLMISHFRMSVFERPLRDRINWAIATIYHLGRTYAERNNDPTFSARLALALARSFCTSTRFELKKDFAKEMFLRGHYLMERIAAHHGKPWREFVLPESLLYFTAEI